MVLEIYPRIYLNEIPLPNFPIKKVNSYIVLGDKRHLIIDTGFNTEEGQTALMEGIRELKMDLRQTDLVLTHMHPDHVGMAAFLHNQGATVYISKIDGELINQIYSEHSKTPLEEYYELLSDDQDIMPAKGKVFGNNQTDGVVFHFLQNGEFLQAGDYLFEVMELPGHTPGHIGLYERKHKLFFCGDHILKTISPSVLFWGFERNILGLYLESLNKVYHLDLNYLLTAHQEILRDPRQRIEELFSEHEKRMNEVRAIIQEGRKTPRETAAQMHWNVSGSWEKFEKSQKFFAIGETLAFLEYLTYRGEIQRLIIDNNLYYEALK